MHASPNATLMILAGDVAPETVVLGLSLRRRIEKAAERAGFGRILSAAEAPAPGSFLPGRVVLLPGSVVPTIPWLRSLREMPLEPERFHTDGEFAALIEAADPAAVLRDLGPEDRLERLLRSRPFVPLSKPSGEESRFAISGPADLPKLEKWLLASLVKQEDGFLARHVNRRISLAISRRLAATRVTPNGMTIASVALGLAGAAFFLPARPAFEFAGALLFLAHSIVDGCDGELARLKFQESRLGGVLDFWGDNVVHCAVFGAIAAGWSRVSGSAWPLALGASAILGTLASAGFVYLQTMAPAKVKEGPLFTSVAREPSRFSRLADALARRDFIYLIVILAAFGLVRWILILAAAGAPLFFLSLLAMARASRASALRSPA
jgi:phosphatidylglycerophosphate synthase